MVRVHSEVAGYAAVGQAVQLVVGSPRFKPFKLLEVRVPTDTIANTIMRVFVNGETRYDLIPTVTDHAYLIDEEFPENTEIQFVVITRTATAQLIGVSAVTDEQL